MPTPVHMAPQLEGVKVKAAVSLGGEFRQYNGGKRVAVGAEIVVPQALVDQTLENYTAAEGKPEKPFTVTGKGSYTAPAPKEAPKRPIDIAKEAGEVASTVPSLGSAAAATRPTGTAGTGGTPPPSS